MNNLKQFITDARNIVVFTGAGISTESGIPDFRSKGGIWEQFRIIEYNEFINSEDARIEDWSRRFHMDDLFHDCGPNIAHQVIAGWVNAGKCSTVITQNIDGLHQRAGTPAEAVIEVHGTAQHANCIDCGKRYEISTCRQIFEEEEKAPYCSQCGGIIKTAVIMFGEQMPELAMRKAYQAAMSCDLLLTLGTSLQVYPAANLPVVAKTNGAMFGIINRDPTPLDDEADFVINSGIGDTLRELGDLP